MLTPAVVALAFAAAYLLAWTTRRSKASLVAGTSWLLYSIYEYLMYARVLCSSECNIRVDLLLFWPGLLAVSIVAMVKLLRGKRTQGQPR